MAATCDGRIIYREGASAELNVAQLLASSLGVIATATANVAHLNGFKLDSIEWSGATAGHYLAVYTASAGVPAMYAMAASSDAHFIKYFDGAFFDNLYIPINEPSSGNVVIITRT